tara:strand:+ start:1728 stop:2693 length:966 start_codon:yes stop_codon:yes gene_type:complete
MDNIHYAFGPESVFIYDVIHNKPIVITNDRINYNAIIDAIKAGDEELVRSLLDENQVVNNVTKGRVTVTGNTVTLDGEELHTAEAKKLVDLLSEGATDVKRWFRFIERLHANPSYNCRQQAYNFIAHSGMPMTEDGKLIGYKGVRDDYKDKYSGKFSNHVGAVLEMQRSGVDDNPDHGCSSGFHVGSHEYADNWAGQDGKLMVVEYCPSDIVSVPNECDYGKLRVCKYTVIAEHTTRTKLNDGAYGHNSNVNLEGVFNYLDHRINENRDNFVAYRHMQQRYPGITMHDIKESIENYSEYHLDCEFDRYTNDYQIKFQTLPI